MEAEACSLNLACKPWLQAKPHSIIHVHFIDGKTEAQRGHEPGWKLWGLGMWQVLSELLWVISSDITPLGESLGIGATGSHKGTWFHALRPRNCLGSLNP